MSRGGSARSTTRTRAGGPRACGGNGGRRGGARGGELSDPFGGHADLAARTLRMVADDAYARDRLRPLRLARFATELGFEPDAATAAATRKWAPAISDVAGERVFAELRRIVVAP